MKQNFGNQYKIYVTTSIYLKIPSESTNKKYKIDIFTFKTVILSDTFTLTTENF